MAYYLSKTVPVGFDEAVKRTTEALKVPGFGIISDIGVKKTMMEKIGADFRNYRILAPATRSSHMRRCSSRTRSARCCPAMS